MDKYTLPTSTEINGIQCEFNTDYRKILYIFQALNDPDLLEDEKIIVALELFYKTEDYKTDLDKAIKEMFFFLTMEEPSSSPKPEKKPLYDWEKDFNIIIAPINHIIGKDVRGMEYLHWWTFLNAFMEIGECTFSTYVGIRDKLNRGVKLEKYEEKLMKDHRDAIVLKKKVDITTQALMDEILGV
jgi:hypothetical protein